MLRDVAYGITRTACQFAEFAAVAGTRMVFVAALTSTACPIAFRCRTPPVCVPVSAGEPDDRGDARISRRMHRGRPAFRCLLAGRSVAKAASAAPGTMRPVKRPTRSGKGGDADQFVASAVEMRPPMFDITDLIAAGYGFRLRSSSYVGNLTRPSYELS
jgi:hypothetical protein